MERSSKSDQSDESRLSRSRLGRHLDLAFHQGLESNPAFDQPIQSPIGRTVGNYRIRSFLGSGAFGIVYVADELNGERTVALKIPRPEVLLDAEKRKRFAAEVALVSQLEHPNIVEVYQAVAAGTQPFIATALCDGPDLGQWMADRKVRSAGLPRWQDSAALIASLADALEHAHEKGISHRDLKPANILLASREGSRSEHGELDAYDGRVTDFGLASVNLASFRRTRSSLLIGTPIYMAPEQVGQSSRQHGSAGRVAAADIYSLGIMLFELLTGSTPVEGENYIEVIGNIRTQPTKRLKHIRSDLPVDLDQIVSVCLRKDPGARYDSASDLANDLRHCLENKPVQGKRFSLFQCVKHWCLQPERIATAGRFAVGSQALLILWLFHVSFFLPAYHVVTAAEGRSIWYQAMMLVLLIHVPMGWAGWKTLQGKRRAMWFGTVFTLFNIPPIVWAIFNEPLVLRELYLKHHPYFSFANHSIVLLCFIVQLILFVVAIIALSQQSQPDSASALQADAT